MAASSSFLQLPFTKNPILPPISPSRPPSSLRSFPSLRPCALSGGPLQWTPPTPAAAIDGSVDPAELSVNPALRNANVLFYRSGYNVQIVVGEDEPEEVLLRRFRREVSKAGVIQECKRRKFFENKQEEKKRKAREAGRRNRRRRFGPRFSSSSSSATANSEAAAAAAKKAADDLEDNWEMPEGDIPL